MNRLIKNVFAVIAIALLISLAAAAMGHTCGGIYADPNEPGNLPEMTPNYLNLNVIAGDSNEPDPMPEMVPNRMGLNVISQDPNEEPAEMVSNI